MQAVAGTWVVARSAPLLGCQPNGRLHTGAARRPHAARTLVARAAAAEPSSVTGVVFEPFSEVKPELSIVSDSANLSKSLARANYAEACEAAVNEQINIEYNVSYVYHALFCYFDRDNVGLPGLAKYFRNASDDEREHAELLMRFQNLRGGHVKLQSILMPEMEFNHPEKGDALYAMELALSLEKLNFHKLRHLHDIAAQHNDAQMCDFIEGNLLAEQAKAVKEAAVYVSMLRRVGRGHGVYHFDRDLQNDRVEDTVEVA